MRGYTVMTHISIEQAKNMVHEMVAVPTVNPMGRPYSGQYPVERPVVEFLERTFAPFGVSLQRQTCSPIHENLLITIPGESDQAATLFESHMDTVPAEDWSDRAFKPWVEQTRMYGRGSCDDKGPLASMVLAALELLENGERPPQTILLLAAGDEEYGGAGITHFLQTCDDKIGRGIFGEPTQVLPMIQHKGTIRWDITVQGRSAHSSRPEIGRNAILDMIQVVRELEVLQDEFRRRYTNPLMSGPSITVTRIAGGITRNAVPDQCTIAVDFRILPGMDREQASCEVKQRVDQLDVEVSHSDFQAFSPSLNTSADDPLTQVVVGECSKRLGRAIEPIGEPFGSDASRVPDEIPVVVIGPGDIRHAHAVNEYVDLREVVDCAAIHRELMLHDWSG